MKDVCDKFSRPLRDWTHLVNPTQDWRPGLASWATFTPSLRDCCVLPARYPASLPVVLGECFRCRPIDRSKETNFDKSDPPAPQSYSIITGPPPG